MPVHGIIPRTGSLLVQLGLQNILGQRSQVYSAVSGRALSRFSRHAKRKNKSFKVKNKITLNDLKKDVTSFSFSCSITEKIMSDDFPSVVFHMRLYFRTSQSEKLPYQFFPSIRIRIRIPGKNNKEPNIKIQIMIIPIQHFVISGKAERAFSTQYLLWNFQLFPDGFQVTPGFHKLKMTPVCAV